MSEGHGNLKSPVGGHQITSAGASSQHQTRCSFSPQHSNIIQHPTNLGIYEGFPTSGYPKMENPNE